MFTHNTSFWRKDFAPVGALREWLEQDKTASDLYISDADMQQWKSITTAQSGFEGPLRWYKAIMRGYNDPDETGECLFRRLWPFSNRELRFELIW